MPGRADVAIVGGGFAGAATAYALASLCDLDVLLLDREEGFGYHASGRNAALGRQLVEESRTTDLTVRGAAFLRRPPPGFSDVPLWNPVGSLLLADSPEQIDDLRRRASARDIACEPIGMQAARRRFPLLEGATGAGGVFVPDDGVIDVHALLMGYLARARRGGVTLHTKAGVEAIAADRGAERLRIRTAQGEVAVRCAVLAAGAWSAEVGITAGARDPGLRPIRRHLFATEPIPDLDRDLPFVWHVGEREFYARPEGGGLLLSGCDEEVSEPGAVATQSGALEALAEKLAAAAPRLAELGVARVWACQRTFSPSRRPVLGWDADVPGLYWVTGLGGHGATASPAIGADAAREIAARLR